MDEHAMVDTEKAKRRIDAKTKVCMEEILNGFNCKPKKNIKYSQRIEIIV
jgi:hypothetical protein